MSLMPAVAIIIISWNTRQLLEQCLRSLEPIVRNEEIEVVVVDNGSTDGTVELCREDFRWAHVVRNEANVGYGNANNRGVSSISASSYLFLNSDTVVAKDELAPLVNILHAEPQTGVVGSRLLNADGTIQRSWMFFPTLLRLAFHELLLCRLSSRLPQMFVEPPVRVTRGHCDWVYGAAMLVRREAFEAVGGFNPQIWMYGEEMELCWRIKRLGWKVRYEPGSKIVHLGEGSWGGDSITPMYLRYRGLLWFYKHYFPAGHVFIAVVLILMGLGIRGVGWLLVWSAIWPFKSGETVVGAMARARAHLTVFLRLCRMLTSRRISR